MTKISIYKIDQDVQGNDKWIGSDAQNQYRTKNFTPTNLAYYFNTNQIIDIGTSVRYMYDTLDIGDTRQMGTLSFETEIGPVVNFSSISTFLLSKYALGNNNVSEYLTFLTGSNVIISKASDINVFGYFTIDSVEPYIVDPNFFVVNLSFISGNGFIKEDFDYLISLVDFGGGGGLFLGSYDSLLLLEAAHPTAENGSYAFINQMGDDLVYFYSTDGDYWWTITSGGSQTLAETLVLGNITDGTDISISDGDAVILDNGSKLKKGTTNAGNGGNNGIALKCSLDYEFKWEAGRMYIMEQDGIGIRETRYNFNVLPIITDDTTKGFAVNSRWILDNGDLYVCTDSTIGAAVWELLSNGVPNLQQVLDMPTRKWITVDGDYTYSFDVFENGFFETYLSNNVTLDEYFFGLNTNGFYSNASDSTGQALFWNNAGSGMQAVFANSFGQNIFIANLPREEAGNASIINPRNLPTGDYYSTISVSGNFANADGEIDLSTLYYPLSSNPAGYLTQQSVLEYADLASFPVTGAINTIYIALDTSLTYYWNGLTYVVTASPVTGITGLGTINTLAMFTPTGASIGNSPLKYDPTIFGGGAVISSKNVQIKGAVQFPLIMDRTGFSSMGFSLGNPGISQSSVFTILNNYRGDILSQTKLYLGLCDGSGVLTYGGLSVEALGKLNITQTPDTGTTSDFVLLRDTSGNVKQIAYPTGGVGTVTSVDLTMPAAFTVSGNPITSSGTLAVTAAGNASQYVRGDGQLATLPSNASGGSAISYYLNGGTAASVATYYQMSKTAVVGTGVDFSLAGNGLISQWLTDVADPNRLEIPAGNWNFEMYMSASSSGGTPAFYVELLKYDGVTFTTIANSSVVPEAITSGTLIDLYLTSLAIPYTTLTVTDRLAVRVYIVNSTGGRTITMHTQDSHFCQIITNFAGGIAALNGLVANTQYLAVGTTGTDFAISSITDTHTFNLPTASATNRGALSSADWSTFNNATLGSFGASFDGMGSVVLINSRTYFRMQKAGTITEWSIVAEGTSPTATFDVWKIASGTALPTVANTIFGTKPALATGNAITSTTLTGWTTTFAANDMFAVNVDACSAATKLQLLIKVVYS